MGNLVGQGFQKSFEEEINFFREALALIIDALEWTEGRDRGERR